MLKNTAIRQQQKKPGQSLSRVDAHRNVFKVRSMLPFLLLLLVGIAATAAVAAAGGIATCRRRPANDAPASAAPWEV